MSTSPSPPSPTSPTRTMDIEDKSSLIKSGNILFYIAISMIVIISVFPFLNYYKLKLNLTQKRWFLVSYSMIGLIISVILIVFSAKINPPSCKDNISTETARKKSNFWLTEKGPDVNNSKYQVNIAKCTIGDVNDSKCWECPDGYEFNKAIINNRSSNAQDIDYSGTCMRTNEKCIYTKPDVAEYQQKYSSRFLTMGIIFTILNIFLVILAFKIDS